MRLLLIIWLEGYQDVAVNFEARIGTSTKLAINSKNALRFFLEIRSCLQQLRFRCCIVEGSHQFACNLFQLLHFCLRLDDNNDRSVRTLLFDFLFNELPMFSCILPDFYVVRE